MKAIPGQTTSELTWAWEEDRLVVHDIPGAALTAGLWAIAMVGVLSVGATFHWVGVGEGVFAAIVMAVALIMGALLKLYRALHAELTWSDNALHIIRHGTWDDTLSLTYPITGSIRRAWVHDQFEHSRVTSWLPCLWLRDGAGEEHLVLASDNGKQLRRFAKDLAESSDGRMAFS